MPYTIEEHQHRFAFWAAGLAASVKGCRFNVESAKQILEDAGLDFVASKIDNLPQPENFDVIHREWRTKIIGSANSYNDSNGNPFSFTHGVAAKLINVYLKSIYVCGGSHNDPRVKAIHPPIDKLLLDALYDENIGQQRDAWRVARNARWSKLSSDQYESVIVAIKNTIPPNPSPNSGLWRIEEYWQGFQ